jgi:hypothetical protein
MTKLPEKNTFIFGIFSRYSHQAGAVARDEQINY